LKIQILSLFGFSGAVFEISSEMILFCIFKKMDKKTVAVILQNIRSVHNVGSVLRTADGAGIEKVICCGYTPTPDHKRMHKVSLGSEKSVSWEQDDSALHACQKLKKEGYTICAVETGKTAEDIFDVKIDSPKIALIFGHEVDGISPEVLDFADRILKIPMRGIKESLNISVAAGIAIYHFAK
jgi:23S rRNA (guanosine2251-2'-O)-methyltransferase